MLKSRVWISALALLIVAFPPTSFAAAKKPAAVEGLCLPEKGPAGSENWPVCGIYMHGLFNGPDFTAADFEIPFRKSISAIAVEKKCRVAAPFGDRGRHRNWNTVSIAEMKSRAKAVCKAELSLRPDIIGFSNGANVLRKQSCETLKEFSHVTLIGPTKQTGNARALACGNVTIIQHHAVPPATSLAKMFSRRGEDEVPTEPSAGPESKPENARAIK